MIISTEVFVCDHNIESHKNEEILGIDDQQLHIQTTENSVGGYNTKLKTTLSENVAFIKLV